MSQLDSIVARMRPKRIIEAGAVLILSAECGCTWTLTAAEYENAGAPDIFRCLHRDDNRIEELEIVREVPVTRMG